MQPAGIAPGRGAGYYGRFFTKTFSSKSMLLFFSLVLTIMLISASSLAAHTATVSLDKTFVRGGATETYTFTVTNNVGSANGLVDVAITLPVDINYVGSISCPLNWVSSYDSPTKTVECSYKLSNQQKIAAGSSGVVSFQAQAGTPGSDSVETWAVTTYDDAGASQTNNPTTTIDVTAPTTTDSGTDANWHNTPVTVTLTATDGSSGVDKTYYTTDGTAPTTSSSQGTSIVLSSTGIYTIKYYSTDKVGNAEIVKTAANEVKIDTVAPVVNSVKIEPPAGQTAVKKSDTITITADTTDTPSGISTATVDLTSLGGSATYPLTFVSGTTYQATYDIPDTATAADGTVELTATATDAATNTNTGTGSFTFDNSLPTASPAIEAPSGQSAVKDNDNIAVSGIVDGTGSTPTLVSATLRQYKSDASEIGSGTPVTSSVSLTGTILSGTVNAGVFDANAASIKLDVIVKDDANNQNVAGLSNALVVDNVQPTLASATISAPTGQTNVKNSDTVDVVVETDSNTENIVTIDASSFGASSAIILSAKSGSYAAFEGSFTVTGASEGAKTVSATVKRISNGASASGTSNLLTIDNTNPAATIALPTTDQYVGGTVTITGTASDVDFKEYKVEYQKDGETTWTQVGSTHITAVAPTGTLETWNTAGMNGVYTLKLTVTDKANNENTATVTINVDNTAPVISAVSDTPDPFSPGASTGIKDTAAISYTLDENAKVTVGLYDASSALVRTLLADANRVSGANSESWNGKNDADTVVSSGTYTYKIDAVDAAGNPATQATGTITVDNDLPAAPIIIMPSSYITVNANGYNILGTAEAGSLVKIPLGDLFAYQQLASGETAFSISVPLTQNAVNSFTVTATDAAGNEGPAATVPAIIEDSMNPTVTLTYDLNRKVRDADTLVIRALFTDANDIDETDAPKISIDYAGTDADIVGMSMTKENNKAWTYSADIPAGNDGTATVTISAKDVAGNSNEPATNNQFTVDNINPSIVSYDVINPIFSPNAPNADGVKDTVTVDVEFSETSNYEINIKNGVGTIVKSWTGTAKNPVPKVWDGTGNTGDGVYTVQVIATDEAGNSITDNSHTITLDTTAPSANIASASGNEGSSIALDASSSTDTGGSGIVSYEWDLDNDGVFDDATGATTSHTWADNGDYPVSVKVTDAAGNSGTATTTVTVNNVAPTVDAGSDQTADEGATVSFSGTASDPGASDTLAYSWDFGDGSAPVTGTLTPTHVYADNNVYTVTLTVTDDDGGVGTDTAIITVNNVAPIASASNNGPVNEGSPATVTASQEDPGTLDTFTYSFDWDNDGVYEIVDQSTADAEHTWNDNGVYTVGVKVKDKDGGEGTATTQVIVNNVAPVADAYGPYAGNEGVAMAFTGSATDAGSKDTFSYSWDFGDGTTSTEQNPTHTYADNGNYAVTLTVTDDDGASNTAATNAVVGNIAPSVTLTAPNGGQNWAGTQQITWTASDVAADTVTIALEYGTDGTTWTPIASGLANTGSYDWNTVEITDGASYLIKATASDEDGGSSSDTSDAVFTVDNAPPVKTGYSPDEYTNTATPTVWFEITDATSGVDEASIEMTIGSISLSNADLEDAGAITPIDGGYRVEYTVDTPYANDENVLASIYAKDMAGNELTATDGFVVDLTPPSITSRNPGINAVGVDPSSNILVRFSEPVNIKVGNVNLAVGETSVPVVVSFDSATNEATIDPDATLNSNTGYTITLSGITDLAGNELPTSSWSFTTATHYIIPLTHGWNLVSLPIVPTSTNVKDILGAEESSVDKVWEYDSVNNKWHMYAPGDESSDLSTMDAGKGYWVSYTKDTSGSLSGWGNLFLEGANTPPQANLVPGWNLVGYYQRENTDGIASKCALKTLRDPDSTTSQWWTMLVGYDNENKQFSHVGFNNDMNPGQGYWVFMTSKLNNYIYGPGLSASECV